MKNSYRLKFAALTDTGLERSGNEDSILTLNFASTTDSRNVSCALFAISDGMGGHNAGEIASMTAVKSIMRTISRGLFQKLSDTDFFTLPDHVYNYHFKKEPSRPRQPNATAVLKRAVRLANAEIIELSRKNPAFFGMGATLTAAVILGENLTIANIGDSRCYYIAEDTITLLTSDHTIVNQLVHLGKISPSEAEIHPAKNFLYKSLGSEEKVEADIFAHRLEGPCSVVLCSDGLSNMLTDDEIRRTVAKGKDPSRTVETLVNMANDAGGKDNISVIVVQIS